MGAGASAIDLAALLHEAGASVQVVARVPRIRFHDPPDNLEPTMLRQNADPVTGIGTGWKLFLCANLPVVSGSCQKSFAWKTCAAFLVPHLAGLPGSKLLGKWE